jgi:HSP20 family protein
LFPQRNEEFRNFEIHEPFCGSPGEKGREGGVHIMQLAPWRRRPSTEVGTFGRELDDLWRQFLGGISFPEIGTRQWIPDVDVSETDGHIKVKAELPGLEATDIDVSLSGDVLTIKGEKKGEEEKEGEDYHYRERYEGAFQRAIRLPSMVNEDKIEASFKNGVLSIDMPKSEEAGRKRIEIKS